MKLLLDTHVFIWWDSDPARLSPAALTVLRDPANTVWPGVVSVWEILIKAQLGKLSVRLPLAEIIARSRPTAFRSWPSPCRIRWRWMGCRLSTRIRSTDC